MKTLQQYFGRDSYYRGDCGNWLVAATLTRDSDCLTRSNFRSMAVLLGGAVESVEIASRKGSTELSDDLAIEEASHWAAGWVQYLIVNPANQQLVESAHKAIKQLEDYPVLDENDLSEIETEEANEIWRNCYNERERVEYIRENRSQFDFCSLADMIQCVRGQYFAGYASELIG